MQKIEDDWNSNSGASLVLEPLSLAPVSHQLYAITKSDIVKRVLLCRVVYHVE